MGIVVYVGNNVGEKKGIDGMDERVEGLYKAFVKHKQYGKALDVLEASYADDRKGTYPLIQKYRRGLTAMVRRGEGEMMKLLRRSYFLTARDYFDDFCIAMEWERQPNQRFYLPRRKQLLRVTEQLQRLTDDEIDVLCVSMPPGVGKTGLAQFYLDFVVGRNPLAGNLIASHNTTFLRGLYEETLRELDPDGEYCWHEIFPERRVVKTNALDLKIDVDKARRFSAFQFRSIQGGNAGLSRAEYPGILYCDDIIEGIEEAMSEERLEAKWTKFNTDLLQRVLGRLRCLVIMTRWSVRDPIGRLEREYENDPRAVFLTMPALDKNDKSNFDYGGKIGYTTESLHKLREMMDSASFAALYQNQPVERSGILYPVDELQRYFDLPMDEPDAVWAVCDTKNKGDDYFCMPIALQYGDKFYIDFFICDNKTPEVVEPRLVDALLKYNVKLARFESNSAGGRIAENVQNKVKDRDGITKIVTKYSTANKETRIIVDSAFVKEHFLFRDVSKYTAEYRTAMNFLVSYTMSGKNRHDDVPDALSMMADFVQTKLRPQAIIMKRPF